MLNMIAFVIRKYIAGYLQILAAMTVPIIMGNLLYHPYFDL